MARVPKDHSLKAVRRNARNVSDHPSRLTRVPLRARTGMMHDAAPLTRLTSDCVV